jgi:hypothetical protein
MLAASFEVVLEAIRPIAALSTPLQGSLPERAAIASSPDTLTTRSPLASETSQI